MDWTKQSEEMARAWQRGQQQIMDGWLQTVSGLGVSPTQSAWRQTLAAWRTAVDGTLDAQAQALGEWARAAGEAAGEADAPWVLQGRDMMSKWIDAQRQTWTSWFQVAATMDPGALGATPSAPTDVVAAWRHTARQMSELQAEWLRAWSGAGAGTAPRSGDGTDGAAAARPEAPGTGAA